MAIKPITLDQLDRLSVDDVTGRLFWDGKRSSRRCRCRGRSTLPLSWAHSPRSSRLLSRRLLSARLAASRA
jgi:hypothetical protein